MTDRRLVLPNEITIPRTLTGRLVHGLARRIRHGVLTLELPGKEVIRQAGRQAGPEAGMQIHRPWALLRKLWRGGALGFGESYLAGDWTSEDLTALLHLLALNESSLGPLATRPGTFNRLAQRWYHMRRSNHRAGSRRNIAAHYDLGNNFYRLWLDPGMTYSSAVYTPGDGDLERAQERKYTRLLDRLGAVCGEHILEIGCGWGGFAEIAARRGLRVTGLTLSEEQHRHASQRMRAQGLQDRVEIRLQDYRDVTERYDHVVSIEMFEAVGEGYWPTYFDTVRKTLKPGGGAALQVITLDDAWFRQYRTTPDFIQRYVFPGGMLPSVNRFSAVAQQAGLDVESIHFHGRDYARTLREWHRRFRKALPRVREQGFDETFIRLWRYYLAYCEAGFRCGRINLMQVILR